MLLPYQSVMMKLVSSAILWKLFNIIYFDIEYPSTTIYVEAYCYVFNQIKVLKNHVNFWHTIFSFHKFIIGLPCTLDPYCWKIYTPQWAMPPFQHQSKTTILVHFLHNLVLFKSKWRSWNQIFQLYFSS